MGFTSDFPSPPHPIPTRLILIVENQLHCRPVGGASSQPLCLLPCPHNLCEFVGGCCVSLTRSGASGSPFHRLALLTKGDGGPGGGACAGDSPQGGCKASPGSFPERQVGTSGSPRGRPGQPAVGELRGRLKCRAQLAVGSQRVRKCWPKPHEILNRLSSHYTVLPAPRKFTVHSNQTLVFIRKTGAVLVRSLQTISSQTARWDVGNLFLICSY